MLFEVDVLRAQSEYAECVAASRLMLRQEDLIDVLRGGSDCRMAGAILIRAGGLEGPSALLRGFLDIGA